jgi:hypothetical protein
MPNSPQNRLGSTWPCGEIGIPGVSARVGTQVGKFLCSAFTRTPGDIYSEFTETTLEIIELIKLIEFIRAVFGLIAWVAEVNSSPMG